MPLPGTPSAPPHPPGPIASEAPLCPVPGAFCSSPEPPCPAPSSVAVLVPRAGKGSGLCPRDPCSLLTCCQRVSGMGRDSCTRHPGPKSSCPRGRGWLVGGQFPGNGRSVLLLSGVSSAGCPQGGGLALPLLLSPPCTRTPLPGTQRGLGSLGPWSGGPYLLGSSCSQHPSFVTETGTQSDPFWL